MTEILHRVNADGALALRTDHDGRVITGVAVPYGQPAEIRSPHEGTFTEVFRHGAFAKTIADRADKITLNMLHDRRQRLPIGRAVELREELGGLYGEWLVSKTTAGDEALALIRDGVPVGLSIGFTPVRDNWSKDRRTVERLEARLEEVSVVNVPAYSGAIVTGVRAFHAGPFVPYDEAQRRLAALAKGFFQ